MSLMLLKKIKKTYFTLVYNLNRHMSTGGGGLSGVLADTIQNNASAICLDNFILFFASQEL